ncbi:MAG: beta-lactamase family protein [Flavobacteriales bacterium]|nr:beta-lactamase family protein [Bacteroidota bacterium]MCB9241953.1 beta-lactamase family protein [Flavobacteriales bacterium]
MIPFNKNILRLLLPAIIGLLVSCKVGIRPLPESIDSELSDAVEHGMDGVLVCINKGNETTFHAAGWKNRENQIPADPKALFKIASISKLYIAAATTKLVAQKRLSLDGKLSEFIPEVKGKIQHADKITLRMLLQHRSGIPDYVFDAGFKNSDPNEEYLTTAALIFDDPAEFQPDKKYKYSNTNYLLIGELLDRTLGYSHHDYIQNTILTPLSLKNTYNLYSETDSNDVVSGYLIGYDPDLKSIDHTRPGGSMVASAEDVAHFLRALIDGTLFSTEEQAIYSSVYVYEHTGWLNGYTSIARYHPDLDAVVIQFVNTSSNSMYWLKLERLYNRIVKILEKED